MEDKELREYTQQQQEKLTENNDMLYRIFYDIMIIVCICEIFAYPMFTNFLTTVLDVVTMVESMMFAWMIILNTRKDYIKTTFIIRALILIMLLDAIFEIAWIIVYPTTFTNIMNLVVVITLPLVLLFIRKRSIDVISSISLIIESEKNRK